MYISVIFAAYLSNSLAPAKSQKIQNYYRGKRVTSSHLSKEIVSALEAEINFLTSSVNS
jgi:hypothetical protein